MKEMVQHGENKSDIPERINLIFQVLLHLTYSFLPMRKTGDTKLKKL